MLLDAAGPIIRSNQQCRGTGVRDLIGALISSLVFCPLHLVRRHLEKEPMQKNRG